VRPGFYPAGGGCMVAEIQPWTERIPVELVAGGPVTRRRAVAMVANLPPGIAARELGVVCNRLGWQDSEVSTHIVDGSPGPGNVLLCEVTRGGVVHVETGFGERGVRAETVAAGVVKRLRRFLDADVPVGEHLADQLLLPMVMAGGGRYRTLPLSCHFRTNCDVIGRFVDVAIDIDRHCTSGGHPTATVAITHSAAPLLRRRQ